MMPTPPSPPNSPSPDRMVLLKRLNASLSDWAASLTWWRMILLGLIVLIAGSWISESLQLSHHVTHKVVKARATKEGAATDANGKPCQEKRIVIGGKEAIVITKAGCKPATPASGAEDAPIKIEVPDANDTGSDTGDADEATTVVKQSTLGGWIGDVLSALLIAFFAYLAAAKIIDAKPPSQTPKCNWPPTPPSAKPCNASWCKRV